MQTTLRDAARASTPLRCMAAVVAAVFAGPVIAQETPTAAPAATNQEASDQPNAVVVVTANKRKQRRQDIAGTVSSLSGSMLEASGVVDAEDVLRRTPGVQTNKGDPNQALPTIRGVGTVTSSNAVGLQQATTGIYIEDVPFTDPVGVTSTPDLAPFDLQGIDILRGPQGALYGSSSLGGAVRYTLNKPDLDRFGFSALVDANGVSKGAIGHSEYVMLNMPLSEQVAGLRTVVFNRRDSGYINNTGAGYARSNELHQRGGRIIGVFKPTDGLKVTGTVLSQVTKVGDGFAVGPDPAQLTVSTPTRSSRKDQFTLANVQVEYDLNGYTLTSSTARVLKRNDARLDQTALWGDISTELDAPALDKVFGPIKLDSQSTSQELRIASPAGARLGFVAGLFYLRYRDTYDSVLSAPGAAALLGNDVVPGDVLYIEYDKDLATEKAAFVDLEYQVSEAWSIGTGGRYYRNTKYGYSESHLFDAVWGVYPPAESYIAASGFTPKFNSKYKFGTSVWYASAAKGYRFGGTNFSTNIPYKSDSLWSYETGLHLAPSRTLSLDLAAYLVKWDDAQVNVKIGTGELAFNGIANVGKATIKGFELAGNWSPVREFSLAFAGAYIDAHTDTEFRARSGREVPAGRRMPGTARLQSSLEASYRFNGPADSSGRASLMHSAIGRRTTNLDKPGELPGYGQLDARLVLSWTQWELAAYVNNIGDRRGASGGATMDSLAGQLYRVYYPIKPRSAGLSLRYDY